VALAVPRSFDDLGTFVLGDHPLHLRQQLFFWCCGWRRLYEHYLGAVPVELFGEQDLISVLAAQPVRRQHKHGIDLSFGDTVT
jgi:hypothetical protein